MASNDLSSTLWVGSIAPFAQPDDVKNVFQRVGRVDSVTMHRGRGAAAQGDCYAFVAMRHSTDAAEAIAELNSIIVPEISRRPLKVIFANKATPDAGGHYPPHRSHDSSSQKVIRGHYITDGPPTQLLWVGNILVGSDEDTIAQTFNAYGSVASVYLHRTRTKGHDYAFITMRSIEHASAALQALNGAKGISITGESSLKVKYATPTGQYVGKDQPITGVTYNAQGARDSTSAGNSHAAPTGGAPTGAVRGYAKAVSGGVAAPAAPIAAAAPIRLPTVNGSAAAAAAHSVGATRLSICANCGAVESPSVVLRKCTGCLSINYCGESCQLQDWNRRHGNECGGLSALVALPPAAMGGCGGVLLSALQDPSSSLARAVTTILTDKLKAAPVL